METPERNIYWRNIPEDWPVYDHGHLFVAGEGDNAAVVYWSGDDSIPAHHMLRVRAKLTRESK